MNKLYETWRLFRMTLQYLSAILLLGMALLAIAELLEYILSVSFEWQQDLVTFGILSGIFFFSGLLRLAELILK